MKLDGRKDVEGLTIARIREVSEVAGWAGDLEPVQGYVHAWLGALE